MKKTLLIFLMVVLGVYSIKAQSLTSTLGKMFEGASSAMVRFISPTVSEEKTSWKLIGRYEGKSLQLTSRGGSASFTAYFKLWAKEGNYAESMVWVLDGPIYWYGGEDRYPCQYGKNPSETECPSDRVRYDSDCGYYYCEYSGRRFYLKNFSL